MEEIERNIHLQKRVVDTDGTTTAWQDVYGNSGQHYRTFDTMDQARAFAQDRMRTFPGRRKLQFRPVIRILQVGDVIREATS